MIAPLSSEYLAVCFFIKLLAFAPVSGTDDSNAIAALDEAPRDDSTPAAPDAKEARFLFAVSFVYSDYSERIEKSTYGKCELTGKPIPKARLAAIPWTRFTVEAQAQLEREGALRQRRLGQLGTVDSAGAVEVEEEDEPEEKPAKEKE